MEMKTTKILTLTFLMSTFGMALSYAQKEQKPGIAPRERTENRMDMVKKSLNLTDEQVVKWQNAQKQLSEDMKQTQAKSKANREEMKSKMDAYDAQLKSILTPEQYQKYKVPAGKRVQKDSTGKMQRGRKGGFQKGQGIPKGRSPQLKDNTLQ